MAVGGRRVWMKVMALTVVICMPVLGTSGMTSALSGHHHSRADSGGDSSVWTATGQSFPSDASTQPSTGDQALSCPGPGSCVAVGNYNTATGNGQDLIDTLSGGIWTPSNAPLPTNAVGAHGLSNISCPMIGACVAVGDYEDTDLDLDGQIETLSDGAWTVVEAPVPPDLPTVNYAVWFSGLTCPVSGSCVAVGRYSDDDPDLQVQPFIDTLSDGTWTSMAAPLPANATTDGYDDADGFSALTCPAVGSCVAVGQYADTNDYEVDGLIDTLADGSWTATEAPEPSYTTVYQDVNLDSVSCADADSCDAVGTYQTVADPTGGDNGPAQSIIEQLSDGTWTDIPAPLPSNASTDALNVISTLSDVSCPADGSCVAIGNYADTTGNPQSLIETQSDGTWAATEGPQSSGDDSGYLQALACPAAGSCIAVGGGAVIETLADGTWTATQAPFPANVSTPGGSGDLDLVSCSAVDSCAALGFYTVLFGSGITAKPLPEDLVETLGIPLAPVIASANHATFTKGRNGIFTINATGAPVPAIVEQGKLPKGLRFTKGAGTATISGKPKAKKLGNFSLTISASNDVKSNVTQSLTLTVTS